ncbi:6-phosphogluconolactonase [Rhinolophus ferrumequinum]|uniref:6-phosphogluconolactonase n=2 Tax=Rhinolophus ferrumequinum TaxID=59479 RepID=A0A671FK26_RHIFE|nr:6-phosphogluconolactonase [Rhinolophus ferrumequinum]
MCHRRPPKALSTGRPGRPKRRRTGGRRERFRLPSVAMAAPAPGLISVFSSPQELGASLAQLVAQRAACCLEGARARFALGLSGGSLVSMLARELPAAAAPAGPASLTRWTLGFCDERLVPFEHAESTYGLYRTHLLSKLPIPDSQVITINPQLPVEEAAEDYAKKLRQAFQGDSIPVFDLLILGVGPDGHTCSLFPDHPLLQEREKIVAPISDSPKPPPQRVTLTLPVLNAARTVIFVATGEGKAAILKRILENKEENPLPAALVQPHTGKLCWFLDEAAARLLTVPFEKHSTL